MDRRSSLASLASVTVLAFACGDDVAPSGGTLTIDFQLEKGGLTACKDVAEVSAVRVRLLAADGVTPLPGWPQAADCETGRLTTSSPAPGSYVLEVTATGNLFGDTEAVLFKARRPITLPGDAQVTLSLAAEVAFLTVSWTFAGSGDLSPCTDEIDTVSIFLGSGAAGSASFQKTDLACSLGQYAIPTPLLPQNYTVKLDAYAKGTGRKLYDVDEQRLLERGLNPTFAVVFEPVGGRLVFDWSFLLGVVPITPCDDARVGVTEVMARVTTMLGDDPIDAVFACDAQRPVAIPGARFTPGTTLTLTLIAEGTERFKVERPVVTVPGDTNLGLIALPAVGSATLTVARTATTACPPVLDGLHVALTVVGARTPAREIDLAATGGTVPVLDVPLADYDVVVEGRAGGVAACRVEARRSITGRNNRWGLIEL